MTLEQLQQTPKNHVRGQNRNQSEQAAGVGSLLMSKFNDLENLDKFAMDKIGSASNQIDGYTTISALIVGASAISKLALAFKSVKSSPKQEKRLDLLFAASETVKDYDASAGASNTVTPDLINAKSSLYLDKFVDDATEYLDSKIAKLTTSESSRQSLTDQDRARLNRSRENLTEISADKRELFVEMHHKLLGSFKVIDSLKGKEADKEYSVRGDFFESIYLSDRDKKEIKIGSKYHAYIENGKFGEKTNILTATEKEALLALPQSREELLREHAGKFIARYMSDSLKEKSISSPLFWKHASSSKEQKYEFIFSHSKQRTLSILANDKENKRIFAAKVFDSGLIKIEKNEIPVQQLKEFVSWSKSNEKKQQSKVIVKGKSL